jgi:hypothetical protein
MAKKGTGKTYTSKGQRPNVAKSIKKAVRRDYVASGQRMINQLEAIANGKRVVLTVPNPDKNDTKRRYIKQVVNG